MQSMTIIRFRGFELAQQSMTIIKFRGFELAPLCSDTAGVLREDLGVAGVHYEEECRMSLQPQH